MAVFWGSLPKLASCGVCLPVTPTPRPSASKHTASVQTYRAKMQSTPVFGASPYASRRDDKDEDGDRDGDKDENEDDDSDGESNNRTRQLSQQKPAANTTSKTESLVPTARPH